jgi:aspartyl-tRNA(Asn)/glutamyl-tRNA(Gln) amidotransferase subunit C
MTITPEGVRQLAKLARLDLRDDEVDQLVRQLPSIVDYVSQLQAIEAPVLVETDVTTLIARNDEHEPSPVRENILNQAPERLEDFWKVDAVFS